MPVVVTTHVCLMKRGGSAVLTASRVVDIVKSLKSHERAVTLWLYTRQDSDELGLNTRSLSSNSSTYPAPLSPARVSSITDKELSSLCMSSLPDVTSISNHVSAPFISSRARVRAAQKPKANAADDGSSSRCRSSLPDFSFVDSCLSAPFASTRARVRTAQLLMAKASIPTATTTSH